MTVSILGLLLLLLLATLLQIGNAQNFWNLHARSGHSKPGQRESGRLADSGFGFWKRSRNVDVDEKWRWNLCLPQYGTRMDAERERLREKFCSFGSTSLSACSVVALTPADRRRCEQAKCPDVCRKADDVIFCIEGCMAVENSKEREQDDMLVPSKRYKAGFADCIHAYCSKEAGQNDYLDCIVEHCQ